MLEYSSTYIAQGAEQSTIEEIRKERTVEREIKEYATKVKMTEETVEDRLHGEQISRIW